MPARRNEPMFPDAYPHARPHAPRRPGLEGPLGELYPLPSGRQNPRKLLLFALVLGALILLLVVLPLL